MSVREGRVCGVPARVFRVSFTGERGFEINVPADYGSDVWQALCADAGLTPYGTEAMHVLRAEKGYIVVGQETDGTVVPADVGLDWTIAKAKRDFVGKRSLTRPDMLRGDRKQLVGLLPLGDAGGRRAGCRGQRRRVARPRHLRLLERDAAPSHRTGTGRCRQGSARASCCTYRWWIARIAVRVTDPVFYDKRGERLHG